MPVLGEVKRGYEIGKKGKELNVWGACPQCGEERWIPKRNVGKPCPSCARFNVTDVPRGEGGRLQRSTSRPCKWASELGLTPERDYLVYLDHCPNCREILWRKISYIGRPCIGCARRSLSQRKKEEVGKRHPRYKGRYKMHAGYVMIKIPDDHPFRCMASGRDRYVMEHRLVIAEELGRPLFKWEVVHHLNGIKDDNRPENLERFPKQAQHLVTQRLHALEKENAALRAEVTELKKRVTVVEGEKTMREYQESKKEVPEWQLKFMYSRGTARQKTGLTRKTQEPESTGG